MCLDFNVSPAIDRTRMSLLAAEPPLKVIRAFELDHGAALVHLHNVSGGILGGDHFEVSVAVGMGAKAQITTTSATRLYKSSADKPTSVQMNHFTVGQDGLLEMLPDPLIPFAQSAYQQRSYIQLEEGAGLFWWETVAPGREARGELFAYHLLALELEIQAGGRPIALEQIRLEPALRPLSSAVRLGAYHYFSTFYICKVGLAPAQWLAFEAELAQLALSLSVADETLWGVSTLVRDGLVVRGLSRDGRNMPKGLLAFWKAAKQALYGQEAVPPRKVY